MGNGRFTYGCDVMRSKCKCKCKAAALRSRHGLSGLEWYYCRTDGIENRTALLMWNCVDGCGVFSALPNETSRATKLCQTFARVSIQLSLLLRCCLSLKVELSCYVCYCLYEMDKQFHHGSQIVQQLDVKKELPKPGS